MIKVHNLGKPVFHLSELEFIDGRIWANVWKTRYIVVIDPENGSVSAIIDCKMLIADAQAISLDIGASMALPGMKISVTCILRANYGLGFIGSVLTQSSDCVTIVGLEGDVLDCFNKASAVCGERRAE